MSCQDGTQWTIPEARYKVKTATAHAHLIPLTAKFDGVVGQLIFLGLSRGNVSMRPSRLPEDPAGLSLAQPVPVPPSLGGTRSTSRCSPFTISSMKVLDRAEVQTVLRAMPAMSQVGCGGQKPVGFTLTYVISPHSDCALRWVKISASSCSLQRNLLDLSAEVMANPGWAEFILVLQRAS